MARQAMYKSPLAGHGFTGLTLVELMVAISIIVVAAAVAVPSYSNYRERAKVAQAITDIGALNANLRLYMTDSKDPPPSLAAIGAAGNLDPWGNPYVYVDLTTAGIAKARKNKNLVPINSEFDLYSKGKDGLSKAPLTVPMSRDDVILANDGRFIGLASNYE
jgi:general secretion pathway protein G